MRNLVKIYKALSDESRLRVLNLLFERPCCVCEVEQALDISQSKASRILSTLYEAGFLNFRKDGLWSMYSIEWDSLDEKIKGVLLAAQAEFAGNERLVTDRERLKTTVRTGSSCNGQVCEETLSGKSK